MTPSGPSGAPDDSPGLHLATISHQGRFWEVHLDFEDDARGEGHRAALSFRPADAETGEGPYRTITLFIEDSYEAVVRKARGFQERQLQALLRSVLP